jgi:hypothetical protein
MDMMCVSVKHTHNFFTIILALRTKITVFDNFDDEFGSQLELRQNEDQKTSKLSERGGNHTEEGITQDCLSSRMLGREKWKYQPSS